MGPRPEGHGESDHRKDLRLGFYALQWGHVQKDMERDPVKGLLNLVFGASMGPRPEGHGEDSGFRCMSFVALASMGPRPEGHGELAWPYSDFLPRSPLQWGHVQKDMESPDKEGTKEKEIMLQWGHVQKDMESHQVVYVSHRLWPGFNGATSRRTWRA